MRALKRMAEVWQQCARRVRRRRDSTGSEWRGVEVGKRGGRSPKIDRRTDVSRGVMTSIRSMPIGGSGVSMEVSGVDSGDSGVAYEFTLRRTQWLWA